MKTPTLRSGLAGALLATAISALGQDAGLVGHWTFDDPTQLGKDFASTNHGTVVGGAVSFGTARVGLGALSVNGIDGHIEVLDSPALRFAVDQSFTLSAWVYLASLPGAWEGIVTKSRDASPWYGIWIGQLNQWHAGGGNGLNGPDVALEWHHVAVVQNGATGARTIYVDGGIGADGAAAEGTGSGALWIGGAAGVTEYFSGLIDDVRLYDRALTEAEIGQLYGTPPPTTSLPLAILDQPQDLIAAVGDKARFVASANAMNLTYQWYKGNAALGTPSPATLVNGRAQAAYEIEALTAGDNGTKYSAVFSGSSGSITSRVATLTIAEAVLSPGFLKREFYGNIPGSTVAELTGAPNFPDAPDQVDRVAPFETASGLGANYGQRLSGFITPWETTNYVFYVASDDQAELYLSTDETVASKQLIATEPSWNSARYWVGPDRRNVDKPENVSAPIRLEAGKRYYVEALQKQGPGGENFAVTVIRQGEAAPENGSVPLGGAFIGVLATPTGETVTITNAPADVLTNELALVTFSVGAMSSAGSPLAYQWQKNRTNIFKGDGPSYTTPPVTAADQGSLYRCVVYLPGNVTATSREALLTMDLDRTPPTLVGILSPQIPGTTTGNEIYLRFSETVDAASGTNTANYTLAPSLRVKSASRVANRPLVVLSTEELAAGTDYTLTVQNVTDVSVSRNPISPTSRVFQVTDLIAHYTFEDPADLGAEVHGMNPGKVVGGAVSTNDSRVGNGALKLNGTSGHIEVADMSLLRFAVDRSYTVSAWVKATALAGGWRGIVNKSRNSSPWYGIWLDSSSHWVGGENNIIGSALTAGWHHAALVQDAAAGTRDLYVDGQSTASGTPIAANGSGPLWIGGAASVSEYFNGVIDDVRIYNRALSEDEVNTLATAPMPAPRVSLSISLESATQTVRVAWPATAAGFSLESSPTLGPAVWSPVNQPPVLQAGQNVVTVPVPGTAQYFRLRQ